MSPMPVVVLNRCDDDPDPKHMIFGRAQCPWCGFFCWLGRETVRAVSEHQVWPVCNRCAPTMCNEDNFFGRLNDG